MSKRLVLAMFVALGLGPAGPAAAAPAAPVKADQGLVRKAVEAPVQMALRPGRCIKWGLRRVCVRWVIRPGTHCLRQKNICARWVRTGGNCMRWVIRGGRKVCASWRPGGPHCAVWHPHCVQWAGGRVCDEWRVMRRCLAYDWR
jgi:hypothetical protein